MYIIDTPFRTCRYAVKFKTPSTNQPQEKMKLPVQTTSAIFAFAVFLTLTPASQVQALKAQTVPAAFDASRIETSRHTYILLMQDIPLGSMVVSATVEGGLISGHSELVISVQGTITSDVSFRADGLRMISSSQLFDLGVMQARTELEYGNGGRVTGRGQMPGPSGIASTDIDTVIGTEVIDSEAMFMLLTTLDWSEGSSFSFSVFQGPTGSVAEANATVEGSESVTVPEGTFDAWKIKISGIQQAIRIWLAKDDGTIVKMAPIGQPVELVLGTPPPPPPID